jgi:hypothetical protein
VHATRLSGRWPQVLSATPPYKLPWDGVRLKNPSQISTHVSNVLAGRAEHMSRVYRFAALDVST